MNHCSIGGSKMKQKLAEVYNLNKYYGKHHVLNDVSFTIYENEIVGFIGPNGAGKSTTMKCMVGLVLKDSGTINIAGFDIEKDREKLLECTSSLIESPGLYPNMSGYDHLVLISKLRNVGKDRLNEMIEFTRLGSMLKMDTSKYSMGMKQRLALAIALMSRPKLLILDEPSSGLDPRGIIELRLTLKELVKNEGISILFSTHQLGEIEKIADRIICINKGKIIELPDIQNTQFSYIITFHDDYNDTNLSSLLNQYAKVEVINHKQFKITLKDKSALKDLIKELNDSNLLIADIRHEVIDIETIYEEVYRGDLL
jgi:ABC-2 type transport system ATP-binding protein